MMVISTGLDNTHSLVSTTSASTSQTVVRYTGLQISKVPLREHECCCPQYSIPAVPPHTGQSVPSFVSDTSTASTQSQSSAIGSAVPSDLRSLSTLVTEGRNLQEAA